MAQNPSETVVNNMSAQPPYGCPRCDKRWGGLNTAHCGACHRTFSGITAFDKHRGGSHARDTRHCLDPETTVFQREDGSEWRLVRLGRNYECWGFEPDDRWNGSAL